MSRRCQFSLRALLVATALLAGWLAVVTSRAREQRQIVAQLEALGWRMRFDWNGEAEGPQGPAWLRRLVGDDYFQKIVGVSLGSRQELDETRTAKSIPLLKKLPDLRTVWHFGDIPEWSRNTLEASLPQCDVAAVWAP